MPGLTLTQLSEAAVTVITNLSNKPNTTDHLTAQQLKAKFDEGLRNIRTYINGSLIPELQTAIDNKLSEVSADDIPNNAVSTVYSGNSIYLNKNSWTDQTGYYKQTVSVLGILSSDEPIIDVDLSRAANQGDAQTADEQWNKIYSATTSANAITFYAKTAPTVNLYFKARCIRK